jgi:hypothetical protein
MDFGPRLKNAINALDLPIATILGTLTATESAALYPMPGGQVVRAYMDGEKDEALNYEYAIKTKDAEKAGEQIWQVTEMLERLNELASMDDSFQFDNISVTSKPSQSIADEQGYFYWVIDFTATLTTFPKGD